MAKTYTLPPLPYAYNALEPHISEQIMKLHHDKHHQAYVNGANAALDKLEKARAGAMQVDVRATLRDLSFNIDGHKLHSIFWPNMAPAGKGGGSPGGKVADRIAADFGAFDKFKAQFSDAAKTVEGSGWALLCYDKEIDSLVLTQVEKQNFMELAELPILLGLDVWEHAYYLQYWNDRGKYVDAWWNVVNWSDVDSRLSRLG
ncbi:MAG: superoxide dismutase [Nitrososphaerota archaeon]|jgi:Fe-Mn family superoxide dismutase|nr:superoxide dismutase [Nitrososphaerota archaeon]MDG6967207.1 superoxide dismutase [Nitrososphaerota archaeon]MDG6978842.1 superoxide dismutase [Nitrososphaerota archaeon]MDG7005828.1 superoxide dismutase [Nitrososphaerota archaeon]MDG7021248.1 superoxide dismutase [Nitrososphaerota archaeon]